MACLLVNKWIQIQKKTTNYTDEKKITKTNILEAKWKWVQKKKDSFVVRTDSFVVLSKKEGKKAHILTAGECMLTPL